MKIKGTLTSVSERLEVLSRNFRAHHPWKRSITGRVGDSKSLSMTAQKVSIFSYFHIWILYSTFEQTIFWSLLPGVGVLTLPRSSPLWPTFLAKTFFFINLHMSSYNFCLLVLIIWNTTKLVNSFTYSMQNGLYGNGL